ncbi:MAG: c-type cytochrome [Oscillatoriales cyanobacterium C42_A2020_001]|nr:c-type cytochrome [Leptolyngbyaceae cyanobacterium C42_A2020_001]
MSKVLATLAIAIALFLLMIRPVWAEASADVLATGANVFNANCAACHANGNNVINASKNLKAEVLHQYGMDSLDAIINQVTNGKSAMPAFKNRLSDAQIQAVAEYVLNQSEQGWKA